MTDHVLTQFSTRPLPIERIGTALAILAFPVLFVAAQWMHPDPFALTMPRTGADFATQINGATKLHLAHFLEFLCAPLLLVLALHLHGRLRPHLPTLAFVALIMAAVGTFMLAGNKAALCLTASAFDTLDESVLFAMAPGFEALLQRRALMAVLWGITLLPLGFALFGLGLWRARLVPRWQAGALLLGSLLLANPEVQAVNTVAAMLLATGLLPYGISLLSSPARGKGLLGLAR